MSSKYPEEIDRALKYAAETSDVRSFLSLLSRPEFEQTRWGQGDHTPRMVAADAFEEAGRGQEAELLRSGRHVVIRGGKVKPGRFAVWRLAHAYGDVQDHALAMTGDDNYQWTIEDHPTLPDHARITHPDWPDQPEDYPLPEARDRLATQLLTMSGMKENGEWHNPEMGSDPEWARLRELILRLRTVPIEETAEERP